MTGERHRPGEDMPVLSHRQAEELLSNQLDGPLDAVGQQTLAAHLAGCPSCSHFAAQLGVMGDGLRELPRLPASPTVARQVRERIHQPATIWDRLGGLLSGQLGLAPVAATAALLVAVVAGAILLNGDGDGTADDNPTVPALTQFVIDRTLSPTRAAGEPSSTPAPGTILPTSAPQTPLLPNIRAEEPAVAPTETTAPEATQPSVPTEVPAETPVPGATETTAPEPPVVPTETATTVPSTATATEIPPTDVPPTSTPTDVVPTATATEVPPAATATDVPPTSTPTDVPPTDVPTQTPARTSTPTDVPTDVPTETATEKPTETATAEPVTETPEPTQEPAARGAPTIAPIDTPVDDPNDVPAEDPVDTGDETPVEQPADESEGGEPTDTPGDDPEDGDDERTIEPIGPTVDGGDPGETPATGSGGPIVETATEEITGDDTPEDPEETPADPEGGDEDSPSAILDETSRISTLPAGTGAPIGQLAFSPDQTLMVLSDETGTSLRVADIQSGQIIQELGAGQYPQWSPLSGAVLFNDTSGGGSTVSLYWRPDNSTFSISDVAEEPVSDVPAGWSGGTAYYLRSYQSGLLELRGWSAETGASTGAVWSSDQVELSGAHPLEANGGFLIPTADSWLLVTPDGGEQVLGGNPLGFVGDGLLSPDGSLLAISAGDGLAIVFVSDPGSVIAQLPYAETLGAGFSWSPDGGSIAVADGSSISVYTAGGDLIGTATSETGITIAGPQFQADGIYFVQTSGEASLRRFNLNRV